MSNVTLFCMIVDKALGLDNPIGLDVMTSLYDNKKYGYDITLPCFKFAPLCKKNPGSIAKDIGKLMYLTYEEFFDLIKVDGPYIHVNFKEAK